MLYILLGEGLQLILLFLKCLSGPEMDLFLARRQAVSACYWTWWIYCCSSCGGSVDIDAVGSVSVVLYMSVVIRGIRGTGLTICW